MKAWSQPDRRERILKAIKELGYRANNRQTIATETKVFGILMESLSEASRVKDLHTDRLWH